jgi:hypothetical protein
MTTKDDQHPDGADSVSNSAPGFFRTNRGIALLLLGLTAALFIYIWTSDWALRELRDGFLLGGFPLIAVVLMAATLLILLFDGEARKAEPEIVALRLQGAVVVISFLLLMGLVFWSFELVGFAPAVALFIFLVSTGLGYRPVWSAGLVAVIVAGMLRGVLYALDVEIDDGLLWAALGRGA